MPNDCATVYQLKESLLFSSARRPLCEVREALKRRGRGKGVGDTFRLCPMASAAPTAREGEGGGKHLQTLHNGQCSPHGALWAVLVQAPWQPKGADRQKALFITSRLHRRRETS